MSAEISHKNSILIGIRPNGAMTADWAHVPKQAEVQQELMPYATGM